MPARGKHPHNRLTALIVRGARPGRHSDGQGLYLHVRSTGARQWMQRLVIQGHRYDLGLGSFDFVSLADARRVALENRRIARAGGDPRVEPAPTFRRVYEVATEMRRKGWDTKATEASWRRGFEKYALPAILSFDCRLNPPHGACKTCPCPTPHAPNRHRSCTGAAPVPHMLL